MTAFEKALLALHPIEGGYSNDSDDAGGETYRGIARNYHPNWEGWKIIDNVKKDPFLRANLNSALEAIIELQYLVESFYKIEFWNKMALDQISNIFEPIALELFDTAVNMGISVAVKFLQRALNLYLNPSQKLIVDGVSGSKTLQALKLIPIKAFPSILVLLNAQQGVSYMEIVERKPSQVKYLDGWIAKRVILS